jgi:hypothetical protein
LVNGAVEAVPRTQVARERSDGRERSYEAFLSWQRERRRAAPAGVREGALRGRGVTMAVAGTTAPVASSDPPLAVGALVAPPQAEELVSAGGDAEAAVEAEAAGEVEAAEAGAAEEEVADMEAEEEVQQAAEAAEEEVVMDIEATEVEVARVDGTGARDGAEAVMEQPEHADIESLRGALSDAEETHALVCRRSAAILRWRRAALWAMSSVSSASRRRAKSAVATALAAAAKAKAWQEEVAAVAVTAEAAQGRMLEQLETERLQRESERESARGEAAAAAQEYATLLAQLAKLQRGESAIVAASRLATAAGLAIAHGAVGGTPPTSPLRERHPMPATRWSEANVECQTDTPVPRGQASRRGRRWTVGLVSCWRAQKVEPWNA